ncbi:Fungal-specific transcription factor domain containing protein [Ceratobasidium theobromae]|uniref:Fungal-specific transcription factor domain containing protein n=1 Tax=Ceratobasidium theobromae TaxID=1582974 RepID=A0A5N5QHA4_9AGAM|nr:Fungal-specific transcription factor domain containing protein [Ceratobasidium theobromae]
MDGCLNCIRNSSTLTFDDTSSLCKKCAIALSGPRIHPDNSETLFNDDWVDWAITSGAPTAESSDLVLFSNELEANFPSVARDIDYPAVPATPNAIEPAHSLRTLNSSFTGDLSASVSIAANLWQPQKVPQEVEFRRPRARETISWGDQILDGSISGLSHISGSIPGDFLEHAGGSCNVYEETHLISTAVGTQAANPTTPYEPNLGLPTLTHSPILGLESFNASAVTRSEDQLAPQALDTVSMDASSHMYMTSGQASLFHALFSLEHPTQSSGVPQLSPQPIGTTTLTKPLAGPLSTSQPQYCEANKDPERIMSIICGTLSLDRNLESNSLPFVLSSYAAWMKQMTFDPLKAAPRTKDYIVRHYADSQDSRWRITLIANIFRAMVYNPVYDLGYLPKLSTLREAIRRTILNSAYRKRNPSREVDMRDSVKALHLTLELIAVSKLDPLSVTFRLMREAAPVFRRACPEPLNRPVHFPGALLHPEPCIRHYAVMDVFFSTITGLPMNIKYSTALRSSLEISALDATEYLGLSWLHGQPDRLTLILARINSLYQEFGTNIDAYILQDIEYAIQGFRANPGRSSDPTLTVTRLVVQEAWRQAVFIYFYMSVCGANSMDSRVLSAQQNFSKLLDDVKPSLKLDMHLAPCMIIAGVVTTQAAERETILSRLHGLPECSRSESCLNDSLRMVQDVWKRTHSEERPAEWTDLRVAASRAIGIYD